MMATQDIPIQVTDLKEARSEHVELAADVASGTQNDSFKNIKTTALVVDAPKADFKLETVYLDEVRGDEILIDMKYSGICHTDIVLQQGLLPMVDFPAISGHEGAGYIRAIGKDVKNKDLRVGDAALLFFNTCGHCKPCVTGHPAYCHTHPQATHNAVRVGDRSTPGTLEDGRAVRSQYFGQSSFAKMSIVNEKCVVKCPYPDQMAIYAPIGCGFQTGAGTVLNVLKPTAEDSTAVFGLGSVGLACLLATKYMHAGRIIAIDIVAEKLQMAKQLGATDVINSKEHPDVVAAVKKLTNGGATQAVDCTGLIKVIEDMIDSIGPLGIAATVGVPPPGAKVKIDALTFLLEKKRYIGVIEGDLNPIEVRERSNHIYTSTNGVQFVPKLMEMHQSGHFAIDRLCRTYSVANLQDAIHDMHKGAVSTTNNPRT